MIRVTATFDGQRIVDIIDENTTVRSFLTDKGVNYQALSVGVDGIPLGIGDFDKSFAALGITSECRIVTVAKSSNA